MPLMDAILIYSDEQAITASAASTNVIDFGETNPNLGAGTPLIINFIVNVAFTALTTLTVFLQHGATSTPATDLVGTYAVAVATLTKGGYIPELMIPSQHLRYTRIYYTVAGTATGPGSVTAYIGTPK